MSITLTGVGVFILDKIILDPLANNCAASYLLSWTPTNLGTYFLERRISGETWSTIYTGTTASFTDTGRTYGTWEYRVKADDEYSNLVSHYVEPAGITKAGFTCVGVDKYSLVTNGSCGSMPGSLLEANSLDCGYNPGICAGTTNLITDPPNLEPNVFYHYTIELGFITATKICAEIECIDDGNRTPTWGIYYDSILSNDYITFGNVSGVIGDKAVYSGSVSLNGSRKIFIWVSAYGITGAGHGQQKINKASW